jgi:hypothetical protein
MIKDDYEARHIVKVVSNETLHAETVPCVIEPETQPTTAWCCLDRGAVTYGASIADTRLVPGQQVHVKVAFVNDSTATFKKITVQLKQKTSWVAKDNRGETRYANSYGGETICETSIPLHDDTAAHHRPLDKAQVQKHKANLMRKRETREQILALLNTDSAYSSTNTQYFYALSSIPLDVDTFFIWGALSRLSTRLKFVSSPPIPVQFLQFR